MHEQFDALVRAIRRVRALQKEFNQAYKNPERRQQITPLLREARTIALANHQLLGQTIQANKSDNKPLDSILGIHRQYQQVLDLNKSFFRTKFDSDRERLRKSEKDLDQLLKALPSI